MAMPQPHAFPHIVRVPGVIGGEPTIQGTRISVRSVVEYYRIYGDVKELCRAWPHVRRSDIEEALAYYQVNKDEIERYIAENNADDDD
jgi:uncharacterized protein (DUF433 family)